MNHDADRPDGPTPPRGAVGGPPAPPDLGDWLRAAREEAGLDLATVASHTHVRATYLEALEREDLAALPEDVYARNFLRLYARALGLDESDALQRFSRLRRLRDDGPDAAVRDDADAPPRAARPRRTPAGRPGPRSPGPRTAPRPSGGTLAAALRAAGPILATVVVAGVVIGTAVWGFNQLLFDPAPPTPTADATTDAPADAPAPSAPDASATTDPAGPDVLAAPDGGIAEGLAGAADDVALSVTTDPPGARVSVDAFALPGVTPLQNVPITARTERTLRIERDGYLPVETTLAFDRDREVVVTLEPEPDAPPPEATGEAGTIRVVVEEASWLEAYQSTARGEGDRLAYTTAQPGDTFTFERPVYLHVGNAGGLEVLVDGEPLVPTLGSRGAVTGRAFPEDAP